MNKAEVVKQVPLFHGLSGNPQALDELAAIMTVRVFAAGHVLIEEGQLGDEFFILTSGQVSIYKKTPDGDTYKVVILNSTSHPSFGEGGLVDSEARTATVVCDAESHCLVLTRNEFLQFCDSHPNWALPVFRKLAQTLMGRLSQTSKDLMLLHKALMTEIRGQ